MGTGGVYDHHRALRDTWNRPLARSSGWQALPHQENVTIEVSTTHKPLGYKVSVYKPDVAFIAKPTATRSGDTPATGTVVLWLKVRNGSDASGDVSIRVECVVTRPPWLLSSVRDHGIFEIPTTTTYSFYAGSICQGTVLQANDQINLTAHIMKDGEVQQSTAANNTVTWQTNTIATLFHHDSSDLMGGLQVSTGCTLSFTLQFRDMANKTSQGALSTTEHCAETVGDDWYQGPSPILASYRVATTTMVAAITPCNILDESGAITRRDNCTIGDQSYGKVSAGSSLSNGYIFKPDTAPASHDDALHTPKIQYFTGDRATDRFEIVSARPPIVGDVVHKVGRTTGWTSGEVIGLDVADPDPTCPGGFLGLSENQRHDPPGTETYIECLSYAEFGAAGGDSGSPVFVRISTSTDDVIFVGVLFGQAGFKGVFVPIDRVYGGVAEAGLRLGPVGAPAPYRHWMLVTRCSRSRPTLGQRVRSSLPSTRETSVRGCTTRPICSATHQQAPQAHYAPARSPSICVTRNWDIPIRATAPQTVRLRKQPC